MSKTAEQKVTARSRRLYATYGITLAEYAFLLKQQGGVCLICQVPHRPEHPLVVDHNHVTMRVRGLLCSECNTGIGLLGDNPVTLQHAIAYLTIEGDYQTGGVNALAKPAKAAI
jgi:Recombination endonuclease VII